MALFYWSRLLLTLMYQQRHAFLQPKSCSVSVQITSRPLQHWCGWLMLMLKHYVLLS